MRATIRLLSAGIAALALLFLTLFTCFAVREREEDREYIRIGLENTLGRIRAMVDNLKLVRKYSDATMLAKARAFARIIAENPSVTTNQPRLESVARLLDVDEVHVSDEKGVLYACVPADRVGIDMHVSEQTRAFLPALTDKSFELAQDPVSAQELFRTDVKGLFQYAGVARSDRSGIVQVGRRALRIEQALKLVDIPNIERTARIGRCGRVSVRPAAGLPPPAKGIRDEVGRHGRAIMAAEADAAGYRVRAWMPLKHPYLSRPWVFNTLLALDIALFVLGLSLFPKLRVLFVRDVHELRTLFADTKGRGFLRTLRSPVALASIAVFAIAITTCWTVSVRTSRNRAKDVLLTAAEDMRATINSSVDLLLFYQGDAICRHYKSPENMSKEDMNDLMRRYGLDELNVVDADGKVLIGSLADSGYDMGSKPKTAEFNCLLNGTKTFSHPFRSAVEDPAIRRKYAGVAFPPPAKGYIQIGFSETRLKDDIDYWFADQAYDWHVGETGYFVIAKDETGVIDSCGNPDCEKGATLAGIGFDVSRAPQDPDEFFQATLFGQKCLCLTETRAFHRIVTALPLAEVLGSAKRIVIVTTAVLLLVLALVVAFMTRLSDLVAMLQGYIAADKERQVKDLTLARTIQTSALPLAFPKEPDYAIFAKMVTAREVGGDFFDFYERPDGKTVFLIADVSGKGVPAALFMMKAKSIIRAAVFERPDSISSAVRIANESLADHNDAEMFVTAWVATYDRATGEIAYVNAGHNPPLIKRADGSVEWIRGRGGLVLAAMPGVPYKSNRCRLAPGDSIFLYTDGVSEAMNVANEQYGEERLEAALRRASRQFVTENGNDVAVFTNGAEQSDDITMLALDRLDETARDI